MAKAIYVLKIFLFRKEYALSPTEVAACRDICIFLAGMYVKVCFTAPLAAKPPNEDLQYLKEIAAYATKDSQISTVILEKLSGHLWYLVPKTAALAFCDQVNPAAKKNLMANDLSRETNTSNINIKRLEQKIAA